MSREGDILLEAADLPGPLTLVRGTITEEELTVPAAITARYGKSRSLDHTSIAVFDNEMREQSKLDVRPVGEDILSPLRIGRKK